MVRRFRVRRRLGRVHHRIVDVGGARLFLRRDAARYLLYVSAISAATEYEEHLRSAFELHRFDLLARYRLPFPTTPPEERAQWRQLMNFIVSGAEPDWRYAPDEPVPLDDRQSR
uniref:hypothetical protein n=1 Tax=Herbidospora sakaeratensis TaxID=564415 RepID=UPI000781C58D|nr:hypothetical protein [Herbidospora sakaeratensis]